MRIKGADGHEYDVTGQGQGTYNTVAGSAGLASFLVLTPTTYWVVGVIAVEP